MGGYVWAYKLLASRLFRPYHVDRTMGLLLELKQELRQVFELDT